MEASFNTVLGTYAAFRHEAARSTLEINHCRLGRVGWDLRDGMSVYLGEGDLSLHSADCCADSVMHFPAEMYAGLMICVDLTHLAESPPPILAEADFQAERLAENSAEAGPSPFRRDRSWRRSSGPCTGSRRCGGCPISG